MIVLFIFLKQVSKPRLQTALIKRTHIKQVLINICSIYLLFVYLKVINIECNIRHKKEKH